MANIAWGETKGEIKLEQWKKIPIPGAICGTGIPYAVFVKKGDPHQLAVGFSGGGACWNHSTCFGLRRYTSFNMPNRPPEAVGIFSEDAQVSAIAKDTQLYFPYCTGDVFSGNHRANYFNQGEDPTDPSVATDSIFLGKTVHHMGRANVYKALEHLKEQNYIDFAEVERLTLYGQSAGAIGAIFHMPTLAALVPENARKAVVADSPGLHFGPKFWSKFSVAQRADFGFMFRQIAIPFNDDDGNVAQHIPLFCQKHRDWNIGILQSSRDFVMSSIFGDISQAKHQVLVMGPKGVFAATKDPSDHCSAWVPHNNSHTFIGHASRAFITIQDKSALAFANDIIFQRLGPNYEGEELSEDSSIPEPREEFAPYKMIDAALTQSAEY